MTKSENIKRKIIMVKENNTNFCQFEGNKLPIYEINGKIYFQDSIPVEMLEIDTDAQPREYDEYQAQKIAKSIEQKVLMQPILTRYDDKSDKILITEGQHRWRAMKDILNEKKIPSIVYISLDINTALRCGLEANWTDRARALSGREISRKTHSLMNETVKFLESENSSEKITEEKVLKHLGATTRANIAKFLLGKITEDLLESPTSKINVYVSSRQSKEKPITAINLAYFLRRLVRLRAVEEPISSAGNFGLRGDELLSILEATNIFTETVLEGKWNFKEPKSRSHIHAKNICRRHPFEACGYFIGKEIMNKGGGDNALGPAYCPYDDIDWKNIRKLLSQKLTDNFWDEPNIFNSRSIEDLQENINKYW